MGKHDRVEPVRDDVHRTKSADPALIARRILAAALALAAVAAVAGLALLWPRGDVPEVGEGFRESQSMAAEATPGTVSGVTTGPCGSPDAGGVFDGAPTPAPPVQPVPGMPPPEAPRDCRLVVVDITDGPDAGHRTLLEMSGQAGEPLLDEGDSIHLTSHAIGPGPDGTPQTRYAFLDINRSTTVWIWMAVTALGIIAVGAWRGVRAIVGLLLTLGVVGFFLVPALLRGGPPIALSLVTGAVVLFPVMFMVHGVNWKSAAALGGTLSSLAAAAGLAHLAIDGADLRGLGEDSNLLIQLYLPTVSVTGLMLAGFIVGALGVLNDATIAQSSTVTELAEADPDATPLQLFASGMRVGRDHIASMVYTLVLAYVGTALPMTLLLSVAERPLTQVLTSDVVATELLRSATGALGLILAVPITTAIAAVTVKVRAPENGRAPEKMRAPEKERAGARREVPEA